MLRRTGVSMCSSATRSSLQAMMELSMKAPSQNRIVVLATSLNPSDNPHWPAWLWDGLCGAQHSESLDVAMLAVTRERSFVGRLHRGRRSATPLPQTASPKAVDRDLLATFLDTHHLPGKTWFVYGGHAVSDHLEFKEFTDVMQMHELAQIFNGKQYCGMLFDTCLQASLDAAYYLRHNTRFIGAAAGYNWEDLTRAEALPSWMFQPQAASAMCRYRDPRTVLSFIGHEYTRTSDHADYAVLDTSHAEPLWRHVQDHYMRRWIEGCELRPEVASGARAIIHSAEKPDGKSGLENQSREYIASFKQKQSKSRAPSVPVLKVAKTNDGIFVPRSFEYRHNFKMPSFITAEDPCDTYVIDLKSNLDPTDRLAHDLFDRVLVHYTASPKATSIYKGKGINGINVALGHWNEESLPLTRTEEKEHAGSLQAMASRHRLEARTSQASRMKLEL